MTNAIKVIYADGREEELNRKLSLEEMQHIVGGNIEIVKAKESRRALVVNEEGLIDNLPRNEKAYALLHKGCDWGQQPGYAHFCLHGNVIVIKD